jgi:hypothetical protein
MAPTYNFSIYAFKRCKYKNCTGETVFMKECIGGRITRIYLISEDATLPFIRLCVQLFRTKLKYFRVNIYYLIHSLANI